MKKNSVVEEVEQPPLLSIIGKTNNIIMSNKPSNTTSSVFTEVTAKTVTQPIVEKKAEVPPVPPEKKNPQPSMPKIEKEEEEIEETNTLVFEVVYYAGDQEVKVYTNKTPTFLPNGAVEIEEAFGKHDLFENVLNVRQVKSSCRVNFEETMLTINATEGLYIKAVQQDRWMYLDYEETKKIFDESVLKAYRELAAQNVKAPIVQQGKATNVIQSSNVVVNEEYQAGNIPVNRPPLIKEL